MIKTAFCSDFSLSKKIIVGDIEISFYRKGRKRRVKIQAPPTTKISVEDNRDAKVN